MKHIVIGGGSIGRRHYQNLKTLGKDVVISSWTSDRCNLLKKQLDKKRKVAVVVATATGVRTEF